MIANPKPDKLQSAQRDFVALLDEAENRVEIIPRTDGELQRATLGVDLRRGEWLRVELYGGPDGIQMITKLTKPSDPMPAPAPFPQTNWPRVPRWFRMFFS